MAVAAAALLATGCGGQAEPADSRPDGRLVLVSGRDDHGEQRLESVDVYDGVDQEHVTAAIDDGTLARVSEIDGQMLHISTIEGPPASGWVDDFYLRGTMHLVGPPPTCRARLAGTWQEPGMQVTVMSVRNGQLLVQGVADPGVRGWSPRELVQELPPQGPSCGADPSGGGHTH